MSYGNIVSRTWKENVLFSVLLELTYKCNLDCYFCYNDLELRGKPLSEEQYFELLDELVKLQVLHLVLSGGEPLAHPAFFRIGARARELGFVTRIKSNGHALNERLAIRVKNEINPFAIDVSLHGASPETHDRQTRVPGSYRRLLANIRIMKDLDLRLKLNAVLTAWNEHELEQMFEVADRFEIPIQMDSTVTSRDDGDSEPTQISASRESFRRLMAIQAQREPERFQQKTDTAGTANSKTCDGNPVESEGKHCGAGSSTLAIDPYGSVFPCVQWRRPLGNLHQQNIHKIWQRAPGLGEVRELTAGVKIRLLEFDEAVSQMGFCPGLAELESGSPTEIYPAAQGRLDAFQQLKAKLSESK